MSRWEEDKDQTYLLRMWADIYEAGFIGFAHQEFGNKIVALFSIDALDKISISPVKKPMNENK